jgi:2-dehydropantoate 2-reductase
MLQDMERGRLTEIDSLNGAVARYGRELSLDTPVNETITAIIKGIESKRQGPPGS